MSRQVYVGNLSSKVEREDLQKEFEKFGKIKDIDMRSNRAFIEFESSEEAKSAMEKMDGKRLDGGKRQQDDGNMKMNDHQPREDQPIEISVSTADARAIGRISAKREIYETPATDATRRATSGRTVRSLGLLHLKKRRGKIAREDDLHRDHHLQSHLGQGLSESIIRASISKNHERDHPHRVIRDNHHHPEAHSESNRNDIKYIQQQMDQARTERKIKCLLNLDIADRLYLQNKYCKSNPRTKRDLKEGYIMHDLKLRRCDLQKIYGQPIMIRDPRKRFRVSEPIVDIAQKIVTKSRLQEQQLRQLDPGTVIACLPQFYSRQKSQTKTLKPQSPLQRRVATVSEQGFRPQSELKVRPQSMHMM